MEVAPKEKNHHLRPFQTGPKQTPSCCPPNLASAQLQQGTQRLTEILPVQAKQRENFNLAEVVDSSPSLTQTF